MRLLPAVLLLSLASPAAGQEIRVTLLGTGAPPPSAVRGGPSILVEAGRERLLFDAGRGALVRLRQVGIRYDSLTGLFLTHLHSDHTVGLPDLWLSGWILTHAQAPLEVWGPPGTADMAKHLEEAFAFDRSIRVSEGKNSEAGGHLLVHEIRPGFVLDRNGVRVTTIEVDHGPVKPAYGYRIDYAGRSVVLSGDTRYSPNVVKAATGVDLLVHEVAATYESPDSARRGILRVWHHTNPAEAGDVFRLAHPKLAVFSHIVTALPDSALVRMTRATYSGPLVVGADLMRFNVGEAVTADSAMAEALARGGGR